MSTQAQAPTPFGEESRNSQYDDPLRLIMQELQSLRDEMRDIRRDVTNLSNQQREVSPRSSLNVTTPRSNGLFNCSMTTEFHQPLHFDEELYPPPYGGRRGDFGGRGMPRHLKKFQDHKLGMESHYMMIMNMIIVTMESLASILGIPDNENHVIMDSNRKTTYDDLDWNFDAEYNYFNISPWAMDRC
ncbi:hypothetical protein M9H77_36420 [Catharanthus roseus]|uniref:Uncharacterized protein n=1 Tax=Catharanthus roseus TaxID=4058 RepID=A0ACB9ZSL7_CATRO|nr:hypothetical protein M9H77_36420 [Catharanthus roseus]